MFIQVIQGRCSDADRLRHAYVDLAPELAPYLTAPLPA